MVLRKAEDGEWELLDITTSLNYTDKSELEDGGILYYTVRAWLGDEESALANQWDPSFWSDCDQDGVYSIGLAAPELIGATALADGTEIEWKASEGASAYAVYRKVTGGSWKMIAVTDELSYVDRSELTSGKTYSYMVRACAGSIFEACANQYDAAYWSGYDSEGIRTVYLSSPELDMAYAAANGTRISWEIVEGADGYAIFRKAEGEDWKLLTMTTDLSYTDASSRESGTVYYYTVRAYVTNASRARANRYDAAYWSGCDSNGVKAVYLEAPVLTGISQSTDSVLVSWESVENADGYAVYRRESGDNWVLLGTTTDTAYADISSESNGSTYYYTVRAYAGAAATTERYSAAYWSGFDPVGLSIETETSYKTRALILAAEFIEANTTSEMTQRQKLDACFNAILRLSYTRTYDTADASNLSSFAEQLFANRTGNCYRYAAGFACIAAELGYDVRVVVGQITARAGGLTPHGWTEVCVDGVWYLCDPDMQAFNSNYSGQYYMTSASAIGLTY
ncbi:MAG: hypothetical protein LUF30_05030, partial [Lachnospiraceae bacterium]|nr:hypothetical protein [Lachnospiraceae bacterium]